MALPTPSMRQLLEAGVHFGHTTRRWNPKMAPYIFGIRNGIHILDLEQTVPLMHQSLSFIRDVVAGGGRVLFVGTKRQASELVAESAKRCGQYYVNHRWLGGMLTNWKTISQSIKRLRELEKELEEEATGLTKKELLTRTRELNKLDRALGGIKDMGGLPDVLFVIDTNKEHIAVAEAKVLNLPVVAILDSNSNPDGITHPVPGNDDAIRAIELYCELVSSSVLDGIQAELAATGGDAGEAEEGPVEPLPESAGAPAEKAAAPAEKTGGGDADAPAEKAAAPAEKTGGGAADAPAQEAAAPAEKTGGGAAVAPAEKAATPAEKTGGGAADAPAQEAATGDAAPALAPAAEVAGKDAGTEEAPKEPAGG